MHSAGQQAGNRSNDGWAGKCPYQRGPWNLQNACDDFNETSKDIRMRGWRRHEQDGRDDQRHPHAKFAAGKATE